MPLSCDGEPRPEGQLWTAAGVIMTSRLRLVYLNFKGGGERQRLITYPESCNELADGTLEHVARCQDIYWLPGDDRMAQRAHSSR